MKSAAHLNRGEITHVGCIPFSLDEGSSRVTKIIESHYTNLAGNKEHCAFMTTTALIKPRTGFYGEQLASEYARAFYHGLKGPAQLVYFDGDTGKETVLDQKSA